MGPPAEPSQGDDPAVGAEAGTANVPAEPAEAKLSPSRVKARAVYEWAIETIQGADRMTLGELFPLILEKLDTTIAATPPGSGELEKLQELRDSLPERADTFGKYLRDAGITRYNTTGERIRRISHFQRRDEI